MEFVALVIYFQEYSLSMNKTALDAIPTTTFAVSVIITADLIGFPTSSTCMAVFAVCETKNMSNLTGPITEMLRLASDI